MDNSQIDELHALCVLIEYRTAMYYRQKQVSLLGVTTTLDKALEYMMARRATDKQIIEWVTDNYDCLY